MVFFSGWAEGSALRNPLSHSLYRSLAAGFSWNSRTRFVEVVLNGSYQGLFLIEEKIKTNKWRINIPKPAADAATGDLTGWVCVQIEPTHKRCHDAGHLQISRRHRLDGC